MKTPLKIILVLISFCSCTSVSKMNRQIYLHQMETLKNSPYKESKRVFSNIDDQKYFRLKRIPDELKNIIFTRNGQDTVFLLESYDHICLGCSSYRLQVLSNDTLYELAREFNEDAKREQLEVKRSKFQPSSTNWHYYLHHAELIEISNKIKSEKSWTDKPLQYGANNCFDGDHTMVTAIYPNGEIESLYVRCWIPQQQRKSKLN